MNQEEKKENGIWKILIRTVKLIGNTSRAYIFVLLGSTLLQSILPAVSLLIMQEIINAIQTNAADLQHLFTLVVFYVSIDLVQTIWQYAFGYYNTKVSLKFTLWLKGQLLTKASELSLKDYEDSDTYDMIRRAQYGESGTVMTFCTNFVQMIGSAVTSFSYLIILFTFRIELIPIVLTIPALKYYVTKKINEKQFAVIKARTGQERKNWYWSFLVTNGNDYKELKLNHLFQYFIDKFRENSKSFNQQDLKIAKESAEKMSVFSVLEQIIDGAIFAYIILQGVIGTILIGNVVTYTRSILQAKTSIQSILLQFAEAHKNRLYLNQVFRLLDYLPEEEAQPDGTASIDKIDTIDIVNLSYRYSGSEAYALKGLTLHLRRGETLTIIGRNGSGKTTLAKILLGFYREYEGEIFVNGINLKRLDLEQYRQKCGALFQDFTQYQATLRENISYGNLNASADDVTLYSAAEKFGLGTILKDKETSVALDMQLGYWFEGGKQISIGQWQKVALARTFIKNADLCILDEPNASLDVISERELSELYTELFKGKIGIIIAHRFSHIVNQTSRIIVMENGRIIEDGTHSQLMQKNGTYQKMFTMQS